MLRAGMPLMAIVAEVWDNDGQVNHHFYDACL